MTSSLSFTDCCIQPIPGQWKTTHLWFKTFPVVITKTCHGPLPNSAAPAGGGGRRLRASETPRAPLETPIVPVRREQRRRRRRMKMTVFKLLSFHLTNRKILRYLSSDSRVVPKIQEKKTEEEVVGSASTSSSPSVAPTPIYQTSSGQYSQC